MIGQNKSVGDASQCGCIRGKHAATGSLEQTVEASGGGDFALALWQRDTRRQSPPWQDAGAGGGRVEGDEHQRADTGSQRKWRQTARLQVAGVRAQEGLWWECGQRHCLWGPGSKGNGGRSGVWPRVCTPELGFHPADNAFIVLSLSWKKHIHQQLGLPLWGQIPRLRI